MHVVGRYLRATPERSTRSHIEKCEAVRDAGFAGTAANFMAPGTLRQPLIAVAVEARLSAVAIEAGVDACWTRPGSHTHTHPHRVCIHATRRRADSPGRVSLDLRSVVGWSMSCIFRKQRRIWVCSSTGSCVSAMRTRCFAGAGSQFGSEVSVRVHNDVYHRTHESGIGSGSRSA